MHRFAPVLPIELYPELDTNNPYDVHFLHAPQVAEASGRVLDWIHNLQGSVILDCWAWELGGQQPDTAQVYEVAMDLMELDLTIVVPDMIHDPKISLNLLEDCGPSLSKLGRLMLVPHGRDLTEWTLCARQMIDVACTFSPFVKDGTSPYPIIGIPKYVASFDKQAGMARWTAAAWLAGYAPKCIAHLLGCWSNLSEITYIMQDHKHVYSCDSTTPFAWAMSNKLYHPWANKLPEKIEMRTDWWYVSAVDAGRMGLAELNIASWKARVAHA